MTVAILRCNGCGHQFFADAIWIRRKLSLYFDADNAILVGRLQAAAESFVVLAVRRENSRGVGARTRAVLKQSRDRRHRVK